MRLPWDPLQVVEGEASHEALTHPNVARVLAVGTRHMPAVRTPAGSSCDAPSVPCCTSHFAAPIRAYSVIVAGPGACLLAWEWDEMLTIPDGLLVPTSQILHWPRIL